MDKDETKSEFWNIGGIAFSPQELSVISKLMKSPSYKEVARKTDLSLRMVMYHINVLMKKTKTNSKDELIAFFRKNHWENNQNDDEKLRKTAFSEKEYFSKYYLYFRRAFVHFLVRWNLFAIFCGKSCFRNEYNGFSEQLFKPSEIERAYR